MNGLGQVHIHQFTVESSFFFDESRLGQETKQPNIIKGDLHELAKHCVFQRAFAWLLTVHFIFFKHGGFLHTILPLAHIRGLTISDLRRCVHIYVGGCRPAFQMHETFGRAGSRTIFLVALFLSLFGNL